MTDEHIKYTMVWILNKFICNIKSFSHAVCSHVLLLQDTKNTFFEDTWMWIYYIFLLNSTLSDIWLNIWCSGWLAGLWNLGHICIMLVVKVKVWWSEFTLDSVPTSCQPLMMRMTDGKEEEEEGHDRERVRMRRREGVITGSNTGQTPQPSG